MKTPPRRKKPRCPKPIKHGEKRELAAIIYQFEENVAYLDTQYIYSNEARKFAKFLNQFADWAESREVLPKKGGARE